MRNGDYGAPSSRGEEGSDFADSKIAMMMSPRKACLAQIAKL